MNELFEIIISMLVLVILCAIPIIGIILLVKFTDWAIKDKKETTPPEEKEIDTENGEAETTDEYPYIKTYLLTKKEWAFYRALKPITDKYNLHILAKVRLADLVEVKKGLNNSQYSKAFNKIKAKHIDFVLARPKNLAILCAIELDDKSHEDINRQQRDFFLDKVCETIKLPIIRCIDINGIEDEICEKLKMYKK